MRPTGEEAFETVVEARLPDNGWRGFPGRASTATARSSRKRCWLSSSRLGPANGQSLKLSAGSGPVNRPLPIHASGWTPTACAPRCAMVSSAVAVCCALHFSRQLLGLNSALEAAREADLPSRGCLRILPPARQTQEGGISKQVQSSRLSSRTRLIRRSAPPLQLRTSSSPVGWSQSCRALAQQRTPPANCLPQVRSRSRRSVTPLRRPRSRARLRGPAAFPAPSRLRA